MGVAFPQICPEKVRDYTAPVYPYTESSVDESAYFLKSWSTVGTDAQLSLNFEYLSSAQTSQILQCYYDSLSGFFPVDLPVNIIGGIDNTSLSNRIRYAGSLEWKFKQEPSINSRSGDYHSVKVDLIAELWEPKNCPGLDPNVITFTRQPVENIGMAEGVFRGAGYYESAYMNGYLFDSSFAFTPAPYQLYIDGIDSTYDTWIDLFYSEPDPGGDPGVYAAWQAAEDAAWTNWVAWFDEQAPLWMQDTFSSASYAYASGTSIGAWTGYQPVLRPVPKTEIGDKMVFEVVAHSSVGSALSYQWQLSLDNGETWFNAINGVLSTVAVTGITSTLATTSKVTNSKYDTYWTYTTNDVTGTLNTVISGAQTATMTLTGVYPFSEYLFSNNGYGSYIVAKVIVSSPGAVDATSGVTTAFFEPD
jgi:hypothetical protein